MRRLPLIPTLVVAAAVATMIALGIWQLRAPSGRRPARRLCRGGDACRRSTSIRCSTGGRPLPPLVLPPRARHLRRARRRARRPCRAQRRATWSARSISSPAAPARTGWPGGIRVNAGWAARPDAARRLSLGGIVAGRLGVVDGGRADHAHRRQRRAAARRRARRRASRSIPNNHLLYAFQWFFFAAAAAVIYVLALRGAAARRSCRRSPERLNRAPSMMQLTILANGLKVASRADAGRRDGRGRPLCRGRLAPRAGAASTASPICSSIWCSRARAAARRARSARRSRMSAAISTPRTDRERHQLHAPRCSPSICRSASS